jgi:S1-C subfamily serine protease
MVKKVANKMVNKVLIGALALALVLAGASGAYTIYLGEKQAAEISALRHEIIAQGEEMQATLDALDNELKGVALGMEQSLINAGELYQEASQSIVRVSDGEKVLGSGFVFDAEGHILTPQHVVEGQNLIYIISADGHTSPATIIGACEYSDIAVLKHSLSIPALTLADSAKVNVGEPVVVIGNPLELPGTITSGIVSQTNRFTDVWYDSKTRGVANLIQLDAAVNFGNSGSPLLNSKGEVIGMIIARIDPSVGEGAYFAVSSNKLQRVTRSLIEQGSFDYPWLGVEITNLTPETAIARNLETVNGTLVKTVMPATPAEAAGIKVDDIIVAINGTSFQDVADLICYLGEYASPGDEVTLTLIRNGVKIELPLTVGQR